MHGMHPSENWESFRESDQIYLLHKINAILDTVPEKLMKKLFDSVFFHFLTGQVHALYMCFYYNRWRTGSHAQVLSLEVLILLVYVDAHYEGQPGHEVSHT